MVIILTGVAGAGKTTVGRILAARLGWEFHDADDLHPACNKEKMRAGVALTDEDRRPWLRAVHSLVKRCLAEGRNAIVACSALKRAYRNEIVADPRRVRLVFLKVSREQLAERLARRTGHFFDPHLLASQFTILEEPADALTVDATAAPERVADAIRTGFGL
ncbi:MAG TPA: gluconokinase, GntK/IdnK-type [Candidatus Binataceae bacterium]|jgi:gluconokinase|nr:gluconokinase, GntK/IdnK-type [Candidatus Binataceae bacterium]